MIKVTDMAAELRSPDLDAQEEFLTHFGWSCGSDEERALHGDRSFHHIHVTEKGEPGFIGIAYYVRARRMYKVAQVPGPGVEDTTHYKASVRLRNPTATRSRSCGVSSSSLPFRCAAIQ